jgi:hypothetical protein
MIVLGKILSLKKVSNLIAIFLLLSFAFVRIHRFLREKQSTLPLHVIVAFESIPHGFDGGERYLAAFVKALSRLNEPKVRITFVYRSSSGHCKASALDASELGAFSTIIELSPVSAEFARLIRTPRSVLLLPLVFFDSCSGPGFNASAEDYATAARTLCYSKDESFCIPIGVFAFEAQAARLESFTTHEPNSEQSKRYNEAARKILAREEKLYKSADVLAMLTPEDLAIAPSTRTGVPRIVVHFRDDVDSRLTLHGSEGASPYSRSVTYSSILPPWASRKGFFFIGGGDSPSNHISLRLFLISSWPLILKAIPSAELHIVGSPPMKLCREHGIWCGWKAHTSFEKSNNLNGIIVHGRLDNIDPIINSVRVAISPLVCGTGINTKTGFSLARGIPVVATEKGARGYSMKVKNTDGVFNREQDQAGGLIISQTMETLSSMAIRLHENEIAWTSASLAALVLTARLDDFRAPASDISELVFSLDNVRGSKMHKK